jgi:plastocyanin
LVLLLALPLAIVAAGRAGDRAVTVHATMPERGGWQPGHLVARVGEPLHLRLTSDDVVHGFAVGAGPDGQKHDSPEVEVKPGQVTELTLTFDRPGTYTYACTRWCGPNHWRMRGTIEVTDAAGKTGTTPSQPPLYVRLGLDLDAPHPAAVVPERTPSASRGDDLNVAYPRQLLAQDAYMTQSPASGMPSPLSGAKTRARTRWRWALLFTARIAPPATARTARATGFSLGVFPAPRASRARPIPYVAPRSSRRLLSPARRCSEPAMLYCRGR